MRLPPFLSFLRRRPRSGTGSLTRRMIGISALWILVLLGGGGVALDRVLTSAITSNFDAQLDYVLTALIASAEPGPGRRGAAQQAARRPAVSSSPIRASISRSAPPSQPTARRGGHDLDLTSRSLWDRRLAVNGSHADFEIHTYDSDQFPAETASGRRARRPAARLADPLAIPGGAEPRRAGRADQRASQDDDPIVRDPRPRTDRSCRAPGLLRPVAAAPRAPGDRLDPLGRKARGSTSASRARSSR